jgi:hypothetical protein
MAELAGDDFGYDGGPPARNWRRQAALALGAAAALGLIWALSVWTTGLMTRDPAEIPFLRAAEGPFKVAPEDPGGLSLDGADRAVTRIMQGENPGETVLAPAGEMPAEEDLPAPLLDEAAPSAPAGGERDAIDAAVARVLAEDGEDGAAEAETPTPEAGALAPAVSRPAPARPRDIAAARSAAPAPEPAAPGIGPGDVVVQLGAFNSREIAEGEWRRHLSRNADLLGELGHVVTTVESGGRTLWRLRAGPLEARRRAQELCAALEARDDACIPARMR